MEVRCWTISYRISDGGCRSHELRRLMKRYGIYVEVDGRRVKIFSTKAVKEIIQIALDCKISLIIQSLTINAEELARQAGGGWRGYKKLLKRGFSEEVSQLSFMY